VPVRSFMERQDRATAVKAIREFVVGFAPATIPR
jgi:hypothetical protein